MIADLVAIWPLRCVLLMAIPMAFRSADVDDLVSPPEQEQR